MKIFSVLLLAAGLAFYACPVGACVVRPVVIAPVADVPAVVTAPVCSQVALCRPGQARRACREKLREQRKALRKALRCSCVATASVVVPLAVVQPAPVACE